MLINHASTGDPLVHSCLHAWFIVKKTLQLSDYNFNRVLIEPLEKPT
jgi:hypothetical protein